MYVTTRYVGVQRGGVDYLFFLLTEDYIQEYRKIADGLMPLLEGFARDLGDAGALVRPFPGGGKDTLGDALRKHWREDRIKPTKSTLPALLVTDVDFDDFDPESNNHLYISLRDAMDNSGDIKVFELKELLDELVLGARIGDLFGVASDYFLEQKRKKSKQAAVDVVEVRPRIFGVSLDVKKGIEFLKSLRQ
jgi:hypothetical protein